jgi:threonine aldolase
MSPVTESPTASVTRKSFGSDNHAGVHPDVMRAILQANAGDAIAYGDDPWTEEARARLGALFGGSAQAFLVLNGSGANVFGLGLLLRRYEAVICASSAHIATDECGASEQILGTKLLTVPALDGKLTPALIAAQLDGRGDDHRAQPGVVAITQSTEFGTCYSLAELEAISSFCRDNGLGLYLDGARLANAAAYLGCSLADIAQHVDVLSFGATKNGALGAEAVIVMRPSLTEAAPYVRKQHMQLASKMRFLAAQFLALLDNDLWLANANHANAMARRLADGLATIPEAEIVYLVQADAVFARLPPAHVERIRQDWFFHTWDEAQSVVRLMTAFDTTEADVDAFLATARATATAG